MTAPQRPSPPHSVVLRGDRDAPLEPLRGRRVALLGFGNQGRAHASNLRDRGVGLVVGGRPDGRGIAEARADGFEAAPLREAVADADLIIVALPDEAHAAAYRDAIEPAAAQGATLGFLHGFSIRYGLLRPRPDLGIVLVAPKGPGTTLRERFLRGQGIPALVAVERESARGDARALMLAWANGLGCARAGLIETTFAHETETDLFGEQAVLCGGIAALVRAAFETLVAAGYPPELAYIECCHEVKQVADLIYARGLAGMRHAISNTAEFGSFVAEERLDDPHLRATLDRLLAEIRDGGFAARMMRDHETGGAWLASKRAAGAAHDLEPTGERVRALMPWLADEGSPATPTP